MRTLLTLFILMGGFSLFAQTDRPAPASTGSTDIDNAETSADPGQPGIMVDSLMMGYEDFIAQVLGSHPLASQADITVEQGLAALRAARGGFDPKLSGGYDQKSFDGKNYFTILNSDLAIPTWGGVTVYGNYQQANGEYLNPERSVPQAGLLSAGVEVNLGNGMFIDRRRADLRKAKIYTNSTEVQRKIMLNDLIYDATEAYWNWVHVYNETVIYRQAVFLARTRHDQVVSSFINGDKPAIDTTEALIQWQNRQFLLNEALMKLNSRRLELSNFLWDDGQPLELRETVKAPRIREQPVERGLVPEVNPINPGHPVIQYYNFQLQSLEIDRRYKAEQLKPKLKVKYNLLSGLQDVSMRPELQNYKWGVDLAFPLFLRKERGELQKTKLEIQQTGLSLDRKQLELENKLEALDVKINLTEDQIDLYSDAVSNYQRLLAGEVRRFEGGESSLFMVNSREQSLIKAELQLLQKLTDYPKLLVDYDRVAGNLTP